MLLLRSLCPFLSGHCLVLMFVCLRLHLWMSVSEVANQSQRACANVSVSVRTATTAKTAAETEERAVSEELCVCSVFACVSARVSACVIVFAERPQTSV